jgi:RNA polymerase sigma-70 factor (ECF subfamily)
VETTDEQVLRALWDAHGPALRAYTVRLTNGDLQWAEDVVQETLLRAWRHPDALRPERGPVRPWLFTVASNIAKDDRRARSARPVEVADTRPVQPDRSGRDGQVDDVERAVDAWLVADALGALSTVHRQVLVHCYYYGRSIAEVAVLLGVPEGTVKSRTHYALRALRLALEERGVDA